MVQVEEQRLEFDPTYEAPIMADYRPFSRMAMAALPLALCSLLAVISPLLWVVPIIAVIVSVLAIRATCYGERKPLGRIPAMLALLFSLFVLGFAPAEYITSRSNMCAQAEQYGREWLELVRSGKLPEAYQLHLMYYDRVAPETDLEKYYEPNFPEGGSQLRKQISVNDPYGEMKDFFMPRPLKELVAAGQKGHYELKSSAVVPDESEFPFTIVELQYRFTYPDNGAEISLPLHIKMKRSLLPTGRKHWNVESATTGGNPPPQRPKSKS